MKQFSTITPTKISFKNKIVNAKIVSVSSDFNHNIHTFFEQELIKQNTLDVVNPLAKIRFIKQNTGSTFWLQGFDYELEIKPFGLFNIWGIHHIHIVNIDKQATTITTIEKNNICKVWNHSLTFKKINENKTKYTDQVLLYAGFLTNLISMFLAFSYKKRHKNWHKLLVQKRG
jgi:hypothetical protein